MRAKTMALAITLMILAWTSGAYADCWCGNGYNDPATNFVEAQVYPGDSGATTWMEFVYTTDGSDPHSSGTAVTEPGTFYQFVGNNDWYQAWLTASSGDLVRWFARAQSADAEVCESEDYQYESGYVPPTYPNVVGDCESELDVGGDWQNNDELSKMYDPETDGVYEVTLTATGDFTSGGGSGYQVVEVSGQWTPQYPGDSNIPIAFTTGEDITFYLDTNAVPGWSPESNAVFDSKKLTEPHTWAAVGDWQGWDPANSETQMTDGGGGIYGVIYYFPPEMVGPHEFKCTADGGWDLQCGTNGYGSNCNTWVFDVTGGQCIGFYIDTNTGRIKVDYDAGPTGTENESWGAVKSMYR